MSPLHEDEPGGEGIVAFELAGSVGRAREILMVWRADGVIDESKVIQVFDILYPLVYASALAGGCIAAAGAWRRLGRERFAAAGIATGWVAFAAAGFDYVENLGLNISLWREPASPARARPGRGAAQVRGDRTSPGVRAHGCERGSDQLGRKVEAG